METSFVLSCFYGVRMSDFDGVGKTNPLRDPERLQALREADLLNTVPEENFDRLARLAARLLEAPLAQVNLLDDRQQFSKSSIASPQWTAGKEAPLEDSFCKITIVTRKPLVVEDARSHPLVSNSAAVTTHGLIAYAGMPLITADGHAFGTLCVGDFQERRWTESELEVLRDLADSVTTEIELRRENRRHVRARDEAAESRRALASLLAHMPGAAYRCMNEPDWPMEVISDGVEDLTGYAAEEFTSGELLFGKLIHPEDRDRVWSGVQDALKHRQPFRLEYRIRTRTGEEKWVWEQGEGIVSATGALVALEGFIKDNTDRKQAEEELRTNATTLSAIFDASPDTIEILDREGRFRWVSPAIRENLGYTPEALVGERMVDLLHPEDQERFAAALREVLGGATEELNLRYRARSRVGEWEVLEGSGRPIRNGHIGGLVLVVRNATERVRLEESVSETESRFRQLAETIEDAFWLMPADLSQVLYISPAYERIWGRSSDSLYENPHDWLHAVHEEDRARVAALFAPERVRQGGYDTEFRIRRSDGEIRWIHDRAFPVASESGEFDRIAGISEDVTDRKKIEEALHLRERQLAEAQRIAGLGSWEWDIQTNTATWSDEHFRQWGYEPQAFTPTYETFMTGIHPEDRDLVAKVTEAAVRERGRFELDYRVVRPDGAVRVMHTRGQVVVDEQGQPRRMIGTEHDITERVRAAEEIREAKEEAEAANRAKSEFLSRTSHELRTPLNAILGFGQLLEMEVEGEDNQESVEQLLGAGRHLLALVDEVLDISKIETGGMDLSVQPVSLREALLDSLDMVQHLGRQHGIQLRAERVVASDHFVAADQQRLKQVLVNLLSNAIKYNQTGGTVTVTCEPSQDERLRICVRDTGYGIPTDQLKRLFTPFDRLGREHTGVDGNGLGLALSKGLVGAMGGRMGVESVDGEGSTFWVELPRAVPERDASAVVQEESQARAETEPIQPTHTVLFVEDNVANVRLIERLFRRRPHVRLLTAMHGRLGLELAREHLPDLILLDQNLPGLSGDEVLIRLRQEPGLREIPVVMISGDAVPSQVQRLLGLGAEAYITKPFDIQELLQLIDAKLKPKGR